MGAFYFLKQMSWVIYLLGGKIDNLLYFLNDYGLSFHISDSLKSQIIFGLGQMWRNTDTIIVWIMCGTTTLKGKYLKWKCIYPVS